MDIPDNHPVMPSNRTLVETNGNYHAAPLPSPPMPRISNSETDHLHHAIPTPAAMPYGIWNSDTNGLHHAAPTPAATPYGIWNSEMDNLYQAALDPTMDCTTWDPTMDCFYLPTLLPPPMPCSSTNSEWAVQRIPMSELQNLGAMKLFRSKLESYAQMRIALLNPRNEVNSGNIPVGSRTNAKDDFMMYRFKVERCPNNKGHHDWTDCEFSHDGEKATRRDPRRYMYSGKPCADFRKRGQCENGDRCHFAHGVFETWLHPDKYKTQMCRDAEKCQRKVCFFAHFNNELREGDGVVEEFSFDLSPKSILCMNRTSPESLDKSINNDITNGMETLTFNTSYNGIQNIENGGAHTVEDRPNSNCYSEEITIDEFPHIIWINDILDS